MSSVFFTDMNTGYAVGAMGTVIKTTDGGTSWDDLSIKTNNNLTSIFFNDVSSGWIVGANGTILNTTNGGTTGINEAKQPDNSANSLKIYPNPATERITVEPSKPGINMNGTISLYGITGQELVKQQLQGSNVQINVSLLPSGLYFVKLVNKEKIEFGKFIKK